MKFIISGRNIDITDGLRTAVEDKLGKLERYFTADTEIIVTLSVEKEYSIDITNVKFGDSPPLERGKR